MERGKELRCVHVSVCLCVHMLYAKNQFLCTVCFLEIHCWHAHRQPNTPYTYTNIHVLSVQQFTVLYVHVNMYVLSLTTEWKLMFLSVKAPVLPFFSD